MLVTPSHAVARLLAERVGYALASSSSCPNGVDLPGRAARRAATCVGTLAALEPVKGLDVSSRPRAPRCPDTRFVIFGTGSQEAELRALAAGLPVEFAGYVPSAEALRSSRCSCCRRSWRRAGSRCWRRWPRASRSSPAASAGSPRRAAGAATLVAAARPGALAAAIRALLDDPALAASACARGRAAAAERSAADRGADARALRGALSRASR